MYVIAVLAAFYSFWPILIMALEGYNIDLGAFFAVLAGKSSCSIGGLTFACSFHPTPAFYLQALGVDAYPRLVANTLMISGLSVAIGFGAGIPVAYALSRIEIRGKDFVSYMLLAVRTVSQFVVLIPLYIAYTLLGLFNTIPGMAIAEQLLVLPVIVWMMRGFFSDIPRDIYDAASVFGKSEWQVFRRVMLPMVIPGIVLVTLFSVVLIWNDFLIADTLTSNATRTVDVGVWEGLSITSLSITASTWNSLNAAGTLAYVPAIALMLAIRRYLARGFSLGMTE